MARVLFSLFLIASLLVPIPSSGGAGCPGIETPIHPLGYEQLTVSTTAVGLTLPAGNVRMAVGVIEDQPVRWRDDGTNPSATVGVKQLAADVLTLCGSVLTRIKFIRQGGTDAKASISYYGN